MTSKGLIEEEYLRGCGGGREWTDPFRYQGVEQGMKSTRQLKGKLVKSYRVL